jgi:hypothetical protein
MCIFGYVVTKDTMFCFSSQLHAFNLSAFVWWVQLFNYRYGLHCCTIDWVLHGWCKPKIWRNQLKENLQLLDLKPINLHCHQWQQMLVIYKRWHILSLNFFWYVLFFSFHIHKTKKKFIYDVSMYINIFEVSNSKFCNFV